MVLAELSLNIRHLPSLQNRETVLSNLLARASHSLAAQAFLLGRGATAGMHLCTIPIREHAGFWRRARRTSVSVLGLWWVKLAHPFLPPFQCLVSGG
jgi:hypothetical protein